MPNAINFINQSVQSVQHGWSQIYRGNSTNLSRALQMLRNGCLQTVAEPLPFDREIAGVGPLLSMGEAAS
ncbi:hypothetical protein [Enterococcus pallens]|uniref:hypothetical protein n=1 Tax=Enterococcus pallens TaxID=160454 RepID=UPI0003A79F9C|nr:hypothetical protein [Enterococcus pallens]OJG78451.1 hypothetical protein RV10_GL001446 [Enterococcus pallens]